MSRVLFISIPIVLIFLLGRAQGAEFEDSGAFLDQRLHGIDQLLLELDERLKVIEQGTPPVDPPVDPPVETCSVVSIEPGQDPFRPNGIPGRIEVEDYDLGGNGIAYMDTSPGNVGEQVFGIGGAYRQDDVDLKPTGDIDGGFQLGWVSDGEWLEYTVCADAGAYDIHLRTTKNTQLAGSVDVFLDGNILGRMSVPFTGSWDANHTTQVLPNVTITAGLHMLRLQIVGGPLDVNWIKFVAAGTALNRPPTGIWLCPPDPVEMALGNVVADTSNDGELCNKGHSG